MMSIPNRGPDLPDPDGAEGSRRGNPASAYDERVTGVIESATTRATAVSHRFGDVRHALTRPDPSTEDEGGDDKPDDESDDEPDDEGTPGSDEESG
jgi:hypothetical protein